MNKFKLCMDGFEHELFIAAVIKKYVDERKITEELGLNVRKNKISNSSFVRLCHVEFNRFKLANTNVNKTSIEGFYQIRFCAVNLRHQTHLNSDSTISWSRNIIFYEERKRYKILLSWFFKAHLIFSSNS